MPPDTRIEARPRLQDEGQSPSSSPPRGEAAVAKSLADQAYERLEEMIVTLKLAPNTMLSEEELGRQLGIGRTPVREAVKRLASDGLVRSVPRRGLQVTEIDVEQELLLLEVRRELERLVARRAALHATEEERSAFAELADAMEKAAAAGDEATYVRFDKTFNDLFLRAGRNPLAARALAPLHSQSRRFWYSHYVGMRGSLPLAGHHHAVIMRAIVRRDPAAAQEAVDRLMDFVEELTQSMMRPAFLEKG